VLFNRLIVSECRFRREGGAHPDRRGWTTTKRWTKGMLKHLITCILNAYLEKGSALFVLFVTRKP
jgi:hypothetical protein